MAFPRIGGAGIGLTNNAGLGGYQGGIATGLTNRIAILPGRRYILPAGTYLVDLDLNSCIQFFDPANQVWVNANSAYYDGQAIVDSDGANVAIANTLGTPVGGLITNAGTGYTNGIGTAVTGCTITASAGASTWVPIVGGAMNTSVTITTAGSGYLFAPNLIIDQPAAGGFPATATCTISAGAINAVTVTNQGAGYASVPKITVVNDPRDTVGSGGVLTGGALSGSGTLTGMYPSAQGSVLTALPTFTFAPASTTAATAIMNWCVTSYTQTAGGTGYSTTAVVFSATHLVAGTSILTNPAYTTGLTTPRPARITAGLSAGALTTANQIVEDNGSGIQAVPIMGVLPVITIPTVVATATANVGGVTATVQIQPI